MSLKKQAKIEIISRIKARRKILPFIQYTWQKPKSPFLVGLHTKEITNTIDEAIEAYERGISSYFIVTLPFRHGKSDIISRYLPPYFFGRLSDSEIILTTHTADLSEKMSKDAAKILQSEKYKRVFLDTRINPKACSASYFEIMNKLGKLFTAGLNGSVTGKGADLLIVDDYLKSRAEAESLTIRNRQWEAFTNDLMTRLAPVHIVIILATRWHIDDIIGRIINKMKEDDDFPKFKLLSFPAMSDKYETGYLFPERFTEKWYKMQFSSLGKYAAAALLQCDPVIRGGNLFRVENIKVEDSFPDNLKYVRFWDLASTEKERVKDDPDYTVGTKAALRKENGKDHLYVANVKRLQAEAPRRNALIKTTAEIDGKGIYQGIESVAGYKDTYTIIKKLLAGKSVVKECNVSKDKIIRATPLEPIFEDGNVHILKGEWNQLWLDEFQAFPSGEHDDQVDSLSGAYEILESRMGTFKASSVKNSDFDR